MRWLLLSLLVLQTATCGQTGPLTLPEEREQAAHADAQRQHRGAIAASSRLNADRPLQVDAG